MSNEFDWIYFVFCALALGYAGMGYYLYGIIGFIFGIIIAIGFTVAFISMKGGNQNDSRNKKHNNRKQTKH